MLSAAQSRAHINRSDACEKFFSTFSLWQQVFSILSQMPHIEFVNLSLNRLQTPILEPPPCPMTNLRSLVLNNTKLNWFTVEELLRLLPSLNELHLSLNEYTEVLLDTIEEDDQGNNNCKPSEECSCDDETSTPSSLGSEGEHREIALQLTTRKITSGALIALFKALCAAMDTVRPQTPMKACENFT